MRLYTLIKLSLLATLITPIASSLGDDTVVLKNGRHIQGTISRDDRHGITITTATGSTYTVSRHKIRRIDIGTREARNSRSMASDATGESAGESGSLAKWDTEETAGSLRIGPLLGLNAANVALSPDTSTSNRIGLIGGGFLEVKIGNFLYVEPQMQYAQSGFSLVSNGDSSTYKYDMIKFPIFLKAKVEPSRDFRFALLAGPSLGFKVNATGIHGATSTDLSNTYESMNFAMEFGAGVEYWVSPKVGLRFDLRYVLGLNNISKTVGQSQKEQDTQYIAGVIFPL